MLINKVITNTHTQTHTHTRLLLNFTNRRKHYAIPNIGFNKRYIF